VLSRDPDWWRGAVIYQIYPRSFQDSNGDGIGDLAGITRRLEHVAGLGADAVWISPFYPSPMRDFGYDVTEYCGVDPRFGTLSDFDALVARAHGLGLRVLIDLVLSHTSDQHPWFRESRASRSNPKADWYVWAEAKPDGTPPNNWLSIFGGPAWEWDPTRQQYYLHNFLKEQPDLNFHCPDVQDALLEVVRFWLDRGVDGFRLDTINFYVHDPLLRDNPPLPPERRDFSTAPAVNPYNWQEHLYDKSRPENLAFLERLRTVLDAYPDRTSVGEVGDAQRGMEIQAAYTEGDARVHMCYGFDFLGPEPLSGTRVAGVMTRWAEVGPRSWACWAFSNHDVVRHPSRWGLDEAAIRLHLALLCSLRGSVCLYQGEELGLTEAELAYEDLRDPYGIRFWPAFKGRDGCRTPMPWEAAAPHGGFSEANPWLPVPAAHLARAVDRQAARADSTLAFYRAMLAYRRRREALVKGTLEIIEARAEYLSLVRRHQGQALFAAFALGPAPQRVAPPPGDWTTDAVAPWPPPSAGGMIGPWGATFALGA
jgi:alpha-glucosidase